MNSIIFGNLGGGGATALPHPPPPPPQLAPLNISYYSRRSLSSIKICFIMNTLFHKPCVGSVLAFFFQNKLQPIVGNEPNLDSSQYRRSDADNFGSVCLVVRQKIDSQTDGHGEYMSVFFPMKKALKICFL